MKEKEVKVTWNEVFNRSVLLGAMPLDGIKGKALCDIIIARVDFDKAVSAFNGRMDEALKKLKEEKFPKFDEESGKPEEERCAEYKAWLEELEKLFGDLRADEARKDYDGKLPTITRDMLTAFCEQGVEGSVTLPGGTEEKPNIIPKYQLLHLIAQWVEE